MAFTSAELSALKSAYASGTTRVTYDGKTVEYDTGSELLARIRFIEAEIDGVAGKRKPSVGLVRFNRG